MYWVVTTFTSIGYGDITGARPIEYLYQILVMMFGICFFGYMTGIFQNIIGSIGITDPLAEEIERVEHWLMKLDKARTNKRLSLEMFESVRSFYDSLLRRDMMHI